MFTSILKTSRVLKCFVDEYAVQSISPVISLQLKSLPRLPELFVRSRMKITMQVHEKNADLFALRIRLWSYNYDLMKQMQRITSIRKKGDPEKYIVSLYLYFYFY